METKINYTLVGLFVVALTLAGVIIAFWLATSSTKQYNRYLVYMEEPVSGLSDESPVKFNGVVVGRVEKISLNRQNPREVILLLDIEEGTPINETSTATLSTSGLTGIGFVSLMGGAPGAPPLRKEPDQPYPVIRSVPSFFFRLDIALSQLTKSANKISKNLNELLSEENQEHLKQTLANLATFTKTMSDNSPAMDKSIKQTAKLLENMATASEKFPKLVDNFTKAGAQTTKTMHDGQMAIETFSEQVLPTATETLGRIQILSDQFIKVTRDLDQNPSILIRGRAPRPLGPGE